MAVVRFKNERRANAALVETVERQRDESLNIGRFVHVPGKGYKVNRWRRIMRILWGAL